MILILHIWTQIALADPGIKPNATGLPGLGLFKEIAGALLTYGIYAAVAGIALGATAYILGGVFTNSRASDLGMKTMGGSLLGALLIGGANELVKFFSNAGGKL